MSIVLQGDFYSTGGDKYTVSLDVAGLTTGPFDFNIRDLKLSYKGDTNKVHQPILASAMRIVFSISNSTVGNIIQGLTGAEEETYRIKIEKNNFLFWVGFVIPDQVVVQDGLFPYDFSIEAVDGIGRLKDRDYTGSGTEWEDEDTVLQHLYNILSFIPLSDYWGNTDAYLRTHQQIFATDQVAGVDVSPLPTTRVNHRVFVNVDPKGKVKRKTAYEALTEFCTMFASRFYFSNGTYRFEQISRYAATDTDITIKVFTKLQVERGNQVYNDWGTRLKTVDRSSIRLAGGADLTVQSGTVNTYLSALSRVTLRYNHFQFRSLLSHISPPPVWNEVANPTIGTGPIDDNSASMRLLLTADVSFNIGFSDPANIEPGYLKMKCTIYVDDGTTTYYLKRTASLVFGFPTYQDAEWTTGVNDFQFYTDMHNGNGSDYFYRLAFFAPPVPGSGDLFIGFDAIELTGIVGDIFAGGTYDLEWEVSNVYAEIYSDGSVNAPTLAQEFYSVNDDDLNSDQLEVNTIFGDGPTGTAFGRLQIFDGTFWIDAEDWRYFPSVTYIPHGALIAEEYLTPRLIPSERIEGALVGVYLPHEIIERDSSRYIFMEGTIDLSQDTVDGTFCFITDVKTTATTNPVATEQVEGLAAATDPPGFYNSTQAVSDWGGGTIAQSSTRANIDSTIVFTTSASIAAAASVSFLTVDERDVIHPFFFGDPVTVIHPFTGESQEFTVSTTEESDKTIAVTTETADIAFPKASLVTPGVNFFLRLLTELRRILVPVQLVPYFLDIPSDSSLTPVQFDSFFRVPEQYDGYMLSKITVAVHTAGSGAVNFVCRVSKTGGLTQDVTQGFTDTQTLQILGTYWELSTGDLIEFFLQSTTATTETRPKGLNITLELIATV